ncbi:class I SAM-dependent methyltransferase [Verrucomicrobiota bacterium]
MDINVKTDWGQCSATYDDLDWVSRDELLDAMVEMADVEEEQKVLDVGTGTGKVLLALKAICPDADYYGVDSCDAMLDKIDAAHNFKLQVRGVENLHGFPKNEFDLVTARMVFHHIDDLDKAMAEVHRVLKPGGKLIICEGNPPDRHSVSFYEEMFRYKEDRNTFLLDDLVNLFVRQHFKKITSKTIVLRDMSLNNWLDKSTIPASNVEIIKKMHQECDESVKRAYNMKIIKDDILMDWKFSLVLGVK